VPLLAAGTTVSGSRASAPVKEGGGSPLRTLARGAVAVSGPFPSWNRPILTEIYLCRACSDPESEDGNGPDRALGIVAGAGGGRAWATALSFSLFLSLSLCVCVCALSFASPFLRQGDFLRVLCCACRGPSCHEAQHVRS
jgi:hypothetical protein